jgi:hypothetical protein
MAPRTETNLRRILEIMAESDGGRHALGLHDKKEETKAKKVYPFEAPDTELMNALERKCKKLGIGRDDLLGAVNARVIEPYANLTKGASKTLLKEMRDEGYYVDLD